MSSLKRSYGKGIDNAGDSSRSISDSKNRGIENFSGETPNSITNFPVIRQADNAHLLPKYTAVLNRSGESGVGMEDLDQLQHDLEMLLSTCSVRIRLLRSEIEEERKDERGKQSLKRKKCDDHLKVRESKNRVRILKAKHYGLQVKTEAPKIIMPRSDTADKFWLGVDAYCADVTKDDIAFLDELIRECSQEVDVKLPELGEQYALEWAEEIMAEEHAVNGVKVTKGKGMINGELRKNGYNAMSDVFASPLTQILVNAFVEEKVMTKFPEVNEKLKASDLSMLKAPVMPSHVNICMELVKQGILKPDDVPKVLAPEDEILQEIKKCQQELSAVNEHNVEQLNKLKDNVIRDQRRLEVKEALRKIDKQVVDMYNKLLIAKQKAVQQQDDDGSKQIQYIKDKEAESIVKQQAQLSRLYFALCE